MFYFKINKDIIIKYKVEIDIIKLEQLKENIANDIQLKNVCLHLITKIDKLLNGHINVINEIEEFISKEENNDKKENNNTKLAFYKVYKKILSCIKMTAVNIIQLEHVLYVEKFFDINSKSFMCSNEYKKMMKTIKNKKNI